MTLDEIAALNDNELARALRHLRGINSTNPTPEQLVEMAEGEACFFQGYARALKHFGHITQAQFAALVWEILGELDQVYERYAPEKAASYVDPEDKHGPGGA